MARKIPPSKGELIGCPHGLIYFSNPNRSLNDLCCRCRSQTTIMPNMNVDEAVSTRWLSLTLAIGIMGFEIICPIF
jgi:hypothetical protein